MGKREKGGYDLTASDLLRIVNGTYVASDDSAARSADVVVGKLTKEELAIVRAMLVGSESVGVDTTEKHLAFSLNPAVNPTYTISGMRLKNEPKGMKDTTVVFKVSPGLDGTLICPNTVIVWMLNCGPAYDEEGNSIINEDKYRAFIKDPASFAGQENVSIVLDMSNEAETPLESLDGNFLLPKLVANSYYVLAISGVDADENEFVSDDVFGFIGSLSGTPPQISFTEPGNQAIIKTSKNVTLKGTIVTTELELGSIDITVDVSNVESGDTVGSFKVSGKGNADDAVTWEKTEYKNDKYTYNWKFSLPDAADYDTYKAETGDEKILMYTATAKATDASGNSATANRAVTVDTVPPKVTISSVIPSVTGYTDGDHEDADAVYVNGTIAISGSVTEMNLSSASYTVYVDEEPVEDKTNVEIKNPASFRIELDTTKLPDDKPVNIVVTAVDRATETGELTTELGSAAGNVGTYSTTELNGGNAYRILQVTDIPVVSMINADSSIKDLAGIKSAVASSEQNPNVITNIFDTKGKLQANVTDDDGVDTVKVKYRALGESGDWKDLSPSYSASNNILSVSLPSNYGDYELEIEVTDKVGTLDTSKVKVSMATAIDDGAPTFKDVLPISGGYYSKTLAASGTVNDASGTVSLVLKDTENGTSANYSEETTLTGTSFSDTITVPAESGTYGVTYVAADKYGQKKEYEISYVDDKLTPEAKSLTVKGLTETSSYLPKSDNEVSVFVKDEGGSGVASVTACFTPAGEETQEIALQQVQDVEPDEEGYRQYAKSISFAEGANELFVKVKDGAGNEKTTDTLTVKIDTVSPTVTAGDVSDSLVNAAEYKADEFVGVKVDAVAADTGSGIAGVWLSTDSIVYAAGEASRKAFDEAKADENAKFLTFALNKAASSWSGTLTVPKALLSDGQHTWYIHAIDGAGRSSVSSPVTFTVDTTAPTVVVNALTSGATYTEESVTNFDATERTAHYTVAGTWFDAVSGTDTLQYTTAAAPETLVDEGTDPATSWVEVPLSDKAAGVTLNWNHGIAVKESLGNTISFRAKDKGGNVSEPKVFTGIAFDFSVPEITLGTKPDSLTNKTVTFTGTIGDKLALEKEGITISVANDKEKTVTPEITESASNTYGFTVTIPAAASHENDGVWNITIDAKDKAGRSAVKKTVTTTIDTAAPKLAETVSFTAENGTLVSEVYYLNGRSSIPALSIKASDAQTDVASVVYAVISGHEVDDISGYEGQYAIDWTGMLAGESGSYGANATGFAKLADGAYTVFVRATDTTGNTSYTKAFKVCNDTVAPELKETDGYGNLVSTDENNEFVLSGTVKDTNYSGMTLKATAGSSDDQVADKVVKTGDAWTITQKVGLSETEDHEFTYIVTATDYAGNEATIGKSVTVDRTPPKVTIAEQSKAYTSEKTLTFTGTAIDANLDVVSAVLLAFDEETSEYKPTETEATPVPDSNGNWTWKVYELGDAKYRISVTAKDKVGHAVTVTGGDVIVDTTEPTTTLKGTGLISIAADGSATELPAGTALDSGASYYAKGAFSLSGTVTEKNFESAGYTVNNGASTALSLEENEWTLAPELTADGSYAYAISLADKAGNKSHYNITVIRDKTPPALSISGLEDGGLYTEAVVKDNEYTVKGTWQDAYAGTSVLQYTMAENPETVEEESTSSDDLRTKWVNVNATKATGVATSWELKIPVTESLKNKISFRAKDVVGNASTAAFENISFDLQEPNVLITSQEPATRTKDEVVIKGTISDSLALEQTGISISAKNDKDKEVQAVITSTAANTFDFTVTIPAADTHANDGVWNITIGATDKAGRYSKDTAKTFTTTIDTTAPELSSMAFATTVGTSSDGIYYFNGAQIPTLTIDASDAGTGISSVMYAAVKGHDTGIDIKTATDNKLAIVWTDVQLSSGASWSVKVPEFSPLDEGAYTVFVRAVDTVGNTSWTDGFKAWNDKTAPTVTETLDPDRPVDGTGKSYAGGDFTLKGTATDNTGLRPVTLKRIEDEEEKTETVTIGTGGAWKIEQEIPDDTDSHAYKYTLTATDYAGNVASLANRTVEIDRTAPVFNEEVALNGKTDSYFTNSRNCTFTGNVTDEAGGSKLKELLIAYYADAGNEPADSAYEKVDVSSDGSFSYTFYDVGEGKYHLKLVALDNAGNKGTPASEVTFDVDLNAPQSTLAVTAGTLLKKDEEAHSATTASPAWDGSDTLITKDAFTLAGNVTDTYGFDADKVELFVGTAKKDFTSVTENFSWTSSASALAWTYTQSVNSTTHADDNTYSYRLKMTDRAGNTVTRTLSVLVDTTAPSATVTAPAESNNYNGTVAAAGMALDGTGSGAMKLDYAIAKLDKTGTATPVEGGTGVLYVTNNQWSNTLTLDAQSRYSLTVTPTDYAGNTGTAQTVTFYYDKTAPTVSDETISGTKTADERTYYTSGTVALSALVSDAISDVSSVYCIVDDSTTKKIMSEETGTAGKYVGELNLDDGTHTIAVYAIDAHGNPTSTPTETTVNIDTTKPVFGAVTAYKTGDEHKTPISSSNAAITVSGTITENIGLLVSGGFVITATKKLGDETTTYTDAQLAGDTNPILTGVTKPGAGKLTDVAWSFTLPSKDDHANDGTWTFTITATDQAGLQTTTEKTVTIDTIVPSIDGQPAVSVSGCSQDRDQVLYFNNTLAMTLEVKATDGAGTGVGSVEYLAMAGDYANWTAAATAIDGGTAPKINWTEAGTTGSSTITAFSSVDEGRYSMFVRVTDAVGNATCSDVIKLVADKTPPTIKDDGSVDKYISVVDGKCTLAGTVFDGTEKGDGTYTDNYLVSVEASSVVTNAADTGISTINWTDGSTSWTLEQPVSDAEGSHGFTFTINASDMAGNKAPTWTKTVYIDKKAPDIVITKLNGSALADDMLLATGNCRFEGTITDDLSGVSEMTGYLLDDDGNKVSGTENGIAVGSGAGEKKWNTTFVVSNDGYYTPAFEASDVAGNESFVEENGQKVYVIKGKRFGVDFFPPSSELKITSGDVYEKETAEGVVTVTKLTNGTDYAETKWNDSKTYYAKGEFTIGGKIKDAFGFIPKDIVLKVNNTVTSLTGFTGEELVTEKTWSYTQSVDAETHADDKEYMYELTLKDKSGNTATKKFIVQVDTTAPTLNLTKPSAGDNEKDENVQLSGTYLDAGIGVQSVSYEIKKGTESVKTGNAVVGGGSWNATISGDDLATLDANQGSLILTVTVKDYLGNEATPAGRQFYRDVTKPTLENPVFVALDSEGNPVSGIVDDGKTWFSSTVLQLTANAQDSQTGLSSVTYKVGTGNETNLPFTPAAGGTAFDPQKASASNVVLQEGENNVTLVATDLVSNKSDPASVTAWVDTTKPVFGATKVYRTSDENKEEITASKEPVTIEGTLTELNFKTLAVTAAQKNGASVAEVPSGVAVATSPTSSSSGSTWTVTVPATIGDGTWTFTVTATDKAGNENTTTASVLIDRTPPEFINETAGTNDYRLMIGGKAFTSDIWYNSDSLSAAGWFNEAEAGSGIKEIQYWVTAAGATRSDKPTGTSDPSRTTGYAKFQAELLSLANGTEFAFKAIDKAGNESGLQTCTIKIDSKAPAIEPLGESEEGYTPFDEPVVVSGINANDKTLHLYVIDEANASGINADSLAVTIGGKSVGATITKEEQTTEDGTSKYKVNVTLPGTTLKTLSGYQPVMLTVKDNAGNPATNTIGTLNIDINPPETKITSHSAGNTVNKKVKVSGTATDVNGIKSITLTATYDGKTKTYSYPAKTGTAGTITYVDASEWSVEIDTTDYGKATPTDLVISVKATDGADNESATVEAGTEGKTPNNITLSLDQNSDRPVVTLLSLKAAGGTLTSGTINGSVSDDDGQIKAEDFAVSEDGTTWYTSSATAVTYTNGSWVFTLPNLGTQGEKHLYFKIKDAAGTEFYIRNDATDDLLKPYVRGNTYSTDKTDEATQLSYTLDTNPPEIMDYQVTMSGETERTTLINGMIFGKKHPNFTLTVTARDTSGIKSISAKFGSLDAVSVEVNHPGTDAVTQALEMSVPTDDTYSGTTMDIVITAVDLNGATGTLTRSVLIDNVPPTLTVKSPVKDTQVIGEAEVRGNSSDGNGSGVMTVGFYVPSNEEISGWTTGGTVTIPESDYDKFTIISDEEGNNRESWSISFTSEDGYGSLGQFFSKIDGIDGTVIWHNYKSEATKDTTYGTEVLDDEGNGTEIWTLPIYFYLEDKAGNVKIDTGYSLNINPDGDRPTAEFTYPSVDDYNKDDQGESLGYIILGGTIRVYGTARDNDAVREVNIQMQKSTYDASGKITGVYETISGYEAAKATGTTSWNYSFDGTSTTIGAPGSTDPSMKDADICNKSRIRVRVRATDINNTVGSWSDWVYITVDMSAPRIGSSNPLKLVKYSNNAAGTGTVETSQSYESGMYIAGTWWLTCSVEDEDDIAQVKLDSVSTSGSGSVQHELKDGDLISGDKLTGRNIKIKLDTSGTGSIKFNIYALDKSTPPQSSTTSVYVRFDNQAPEQTFLKNGASEIGNGQNGTVKVTQSNYIYTISSTVEESGSGLERVAMYFKRADKSDSTKTRLYDPRFAPTVGTDDKANQITGYSLADGLPGKTVTATARTADSFTLSEKDKFITRGSLVKIAGIYRIVGSVSETGATYTFSPADSTLDTNIELVYALVIDNTKVESVGMSEGKVVIGNDDGDGFYDYVSDDGSSFSWKMSFDSTNIPDGPIDICYVAFDKAGNASTLRTTNTAVSNNAPRIAKIFLATDLSGNGEFESDEEIDYSMIRTNDEGYQEAVENAEIDAITNTLSTKNFIAKGKTRMKAEIVGGNNSLYYGWKYRTGTLSNGTVTWSGTETVGKTVDTSTPIGTTAGSMDIASKTYDANGREIAKTTPTTTKVAAITHTVANEKLDGISDGCVKIVYTFWDGTEETTPGADSQFATVTAAFTVDVVDEMSPNAVVDPFYWESNAKNSLFGNSTANGHIELEDDWKNAPGYVSTATSGEYDGDPKVSGKITIRGSANDESRLTEIWAHIDGFVFSEKSGDAETIESATKFGFASDGKTETATTDGITYYKVATYNNGWTGTGADTLANGWHFQVTKNDLSQAGHAIDWQLDFDTSRIDGVAGTDKNIRIIAVDARTSTVKNASSETAKGTAGESAYNNPDYRVDVVPYVSKVYTKLAKDKKTNWSVYNRTALGHYPVQSVVSNIDASINLNASTSEDITLYGFNLNSDDAIIVSGGKTFTVGDINSDVDKANTLKMFVSNADGFDQIQFNAANLQSGALNLSVNGISFMNNRNNNDAKGDASTPGSAYANWYNRQGNGDTNNILTDDVEFDVWEFNDRAAVPINGLATGICMEVNQRTGMLNYAFANGGLYYSMGGNTDKTTAYNKTNSYSSIYWVGDYDTFAGPCVGFHVDDLGYTYSVDSGGDTNTGGSVDKWDLWTSRWGMGRRGQRGTLNDDNGDVNTFAAVRLEEIALKTGNNTMAYSLMKYRYLSAEFASTVDTSASTTNLYLVYYDALTNQIRFRAGTFSGTTRETPGGFTDQYTTGASSYYNTDNCQVIANAAAGGSFTVSNGTKTVNGISGRGAGQYVDVAVVKNSESKDVVCVVWYDQEDNCCKFSYITDPIANWTKLKGNATALNWSEPVTVFEEGGEYCHIVSDKNNHLHIAAYAGNGDVMYAYLDSYNEYHGAEDKATVTQLPSSAVSAVDASGAVGEHLTLDVAVSENGHSIPYIGYYTAAIKRPKYAYLVDKTTGFNQTAAGVDDDERYTGSWEVAVVPTPSRMTTNREDKVNVGVWKNGGVLTDSKISGDVKNSSRGGSLNGYGSTNWSKTFGNGTSNGVLGYQISTSTGSCLETAQMR